MGARIYDIERQNVARDMILGGIRPQIVAHHLDLSKEAAHRLYRDLIGGPTPRGQLPHSVVTRIRSYPGAAQAAVIAKILQRRIPETSPIQGLDFARAIIRTYYEYAAIVDGPLLDMQDVWYIAREMTLNGSLTLRRCQDCGSSYLYDPAGYPPLRRCPYHRNPAAG